MKTTSEMMREIEEVRLSLPEELDISSNDVHASGIYSLRSLYRDIILSDLDYALDKKVEQELWNICFKTPISKLQSNNRNTSSLKNSNNPLLQWFLESASGFYLVLVQEICTLCQSPSEEAASNIYKTNNQLGIFSRGSSEYQAKPVKNASWRYILQHCLIHLGDLARYRNLQSEAENYYQQAARIEPSSGHPYNQLALLESARGDKLSTLFYYIRSLAVKHPFPPARSNLDKVLKKQSVNSLVKSRSGRLTADEFLIAFAKLQGQIGLGCDLEQAEQIVRLLSIALPPLVATEAFSPSQLIKILAITIYAAEETSSEVQKRLSVELVASILCACLTASSCSTPVSSSVFLAPAKLAFDWFRMKPEFLVYTTSPNQLWPAAARLFNELQTALKIENEDDDEGALTEDFELLEFTPLGRSVSKRQLTTGDERLIRARRIVNLGKWFVSELNSSSLTVTEQPEGDCRLVFSSLQQTETSVQMATLDEITERIDRIEAGLESANNLPEIIKILPRPPQQRNVALTALLKQKPAEESHTPPPPAQPILPVPQPVQQKKAPLLPLPPSVKPIVSLGSGPGVYPRPSLPPRLERIKAEQAQRQLLHQPQSFGGLPDLSLPPPPPPGLGFPHLPPPPVWSQLPPPSVSPYTLWSAAGNQSTPINSSFMALAASGGPVVNSRSTAAGSSLWSGPGPSPLERLLEQQKALRGSTPSNKNIKP